MTESPTDPASVREFYDAHVAAKLRDFIDGNLRVERAWATIETHAPHQPAHILEIGCGIGQTSWHMSKRWPSARITGLDISTRSIELARRLFGASGIDFVEGHAAECDLEGPYDLITLIDVYEHIAAPDRPALHTKLSRLMGDRSRLVLTFPTPRLLQWLREAQPQHIQPIDEDVSVDTIAALASDTGTSILFYAEQSIWHAGDYAHAVLGRAPDLAPVAPPQPPSARALVRRGLQHARRLAMERTFPPRTERLRMLRERAGLSYQDIVDPGSRGG